MVEYANDNNIGEFLNNNEIVIIDFSAGWCGPCKMFSPVFEKYANDHPEIKFVKVDIDQSPKLTGNYKIRGVPTVCVLNKKELVGTRSGLMNYAQFDGFINSVL